MMHIPYIDDNALIAHSIINFFKSFKTVKSFEWRVKKMVTLILKNLFQKCFNS